MGFEGIRRYKLKDVCVKIGSGATPTGGKESYSNEGEISLIRSQNVLDFTFSTNGLAFINEEQARKLNNVQVLEGDVLLNITGDSVARVCQAPGFVLPARVNQHVAIIRTDERQLSNGYLKYYLLNPGYKEFMLGLASVGATRNALTKGMIEDFNIDLPDLPTQQRIAAILSAFDDKIALNRQMNQTLEEMARAVFKSVMLTDTKVSFLDYIELNPRLFIKKNAPAKFIEMRDLPEKGSSIENFAIRPFSSGMKFQQNDTLLARITPCLENGKSAFVDLLEGDEIAHGSTEFIVMRARPGISPYYVYLLARETDFREHAIKSMVGTSGRQRVQNDGLVQFKLNKIEPEDMLRFHQLVQPMFQQIKNNVDQSRTLAELRDSLLPKLMKGEIAV